MSLLIVVNCGDYPLPTHAGYINNNGVMFNQSISVQCLPGFEPRNITTVTCRASGEWDNTDPPICAPGMLIARKKVVFHFTWPHFGYIACDLKFALLHALQVYCVLIQFVHRMEWSLTPLPCTPHMLVV